MFRWMAGWLCACAMAGTAAAAPIMNGTFSTAGSPFANWTTTYGTAPTDGGGFAVFQDDNVSSAIQLQQTFDLPLNTVQLQFMLRFSTPPGGTNDMISPDGFQASLIDPNGLMGPEYLFPANGVAFPGYYGIDSSYFEQTGTGAARSGQFVTLNVSSVAGRVVTIEFLLTLANDGVFTRVEVDNVSIRLAALPNPEVPEPGTLAVAAALAGLAAVRRARRTRAVA